MAFVLKAMILSKMTVREGMKNRGRETLKMISWHDLSLWIRDVVIHLYLENTAVSADPILFKNVSLG